MHASKLSCYPGEEAVAEVELGAIHTGHGAKRTTCLASPPRKSPSFRVCGEYALNAKGTSICRIDIAISFAPPWPVGDIAALPMDTLISTRHISSQIGSGRQVIVNLTAFDSDNGRIGDRVSCTGGGQLSLTHGTDALRLHCGERGKLLGVEHRLCAPSENTTRV